MLTRMLQIFSRDRRNSFYFNFLCTVFRLVAFIQYLFKAVGAQSIHSPFVFELYQEVICAKKQFYCFQQIEKLRKELLKDQSVLTVEDFGAKGENGRVSQRRVSQIAGTSLKSKRYAQLIFRLVESRKPTSVLELGTSLGITTAYLANATPNGIVVSMEGSSDILHRAEAHLKKLQLNHKCILVQGPFQQTLPKVLNRKYDVVFIDGHHQGDALKGYLQQIKPSLADDAVVIVDDINWSADMKQAWDDVQQDPDFSVSIDLFELGLLFNAPETPKQHFVLRFMPRGF